MQLLSTLLVRLLNLALAGYGLYTSGPRLLGRFNVENTTSFLVAVVPFAATAVFALGARTKPVWLVAAAFNLLAMLGMIGLIVFVKSTQQAADAGAFIGGLAVAGVIATANLAFLVWRAPRASKVDSAPVKEAR
jgi:hypothetical protein